MHKNGQVVFEDGQLSLGETMADLAGLSIARRALAKRLGGESHMRRAADAVVAAATAPSPPPVPAEPQAEAPKSTAIDAPSWSMSALAVPIIDDDFDVEPSLVYTDSAHYLADHGVQIPM